MNGWMISLALYLTLPFDSPFTTPRNCCAHLFSLPSQTMNNHYLYPDQCEWMEDYQDLKRARRVHTVTHPSRWLDDDGDLMSYESEDVI